MSGTNPPLYCTITLIAMQGHLHWVVAHNLMLVGYNTVQYSNLVKIHDNMVSSNHTIKKYEL